MTLKALPRSQALVPFWGPDLQLAIPLCLKIYIYKANYFSNVFFSLFFLGISTYFLCLPFHL